MHYSRQYLQHQDNPTNLSDPNIVPKFVILKGSSKLNMVVFNLLLPRQIEELLATRVNYLIRRSDAKSALWLCTR